MKIIRFLIPITLKILPFLMVAILLVGFVVVGIKNANATTDETQTLVIQEVEKNGVVVSLHEFSNEKGYADIVACFDYPDNGDWLPSAIIKNGQEQVSMNALTLINAYEEKTHLSNHRCYHLDFPVQVEEGSKFEITRIEKSMPETITEADCVKAQAIIQKEYPGFEFKCVIDHGIRFEITNQPENMKGINVNQLIADNLSDAVEGPWSFEINLK